MTDLITKLADDIHALIQASPRSPTKEEIEGALRQMADSDMRWRKWCPQCGAQALAVCYADKATDDWAGLCTNCGWLHNLVPAQRPAGYLVSQEDWDKGLAEYAAQETSKLKAVMREHEEKWWADACNRPTLMPLPYKEPSTEVMALLKELEDHNRKEAEETARIISALSGHPEATEF